MKRAKRSSRRSESEIRALVAGYESGNQSRVDYCARHGIAVTTLDYYRRRYRPAESGLVEIDLRGAGMAPGPDRGVTIVLDNGRRVEIEWAGVARAAGHGQSLRTLLALLEEA